MNLNENLILEQEQHQAFLALVKEAPNRPPEETLLAYGDPFLIAVQDRSGNFRQKHVKEKAVDDKSASTANGGTSSKPDGPKGNTKCTVQNDSSIEIQEILNKVYPPQVWRDDDKIYQRNVSLVPATRKDMVNLQNHLDDIIKRKNLKGTGLDEKRRKYFGQCFDELIRQEIIRCLPRGLLLLRIRDEIRMSLQAYEELYLSITAYGVRKAVTIEVENQRYEDELAHIVEERRSLLAQIDAVREQMSQHEEKFKMQHAHYKRVFSDERDALRRHNQNMKTQLEAIISSSKKD